MSFIIREKDYPAARISSVYGPRNISISNSPFHRGTDIAMPRRTRLHSLWKGRIITNTTNSGGPSNGYGHYIRIEHRELGLTTLYAHLEELSPLRVGQEVEAGQFVALSGNTGNSSGPHVHIEIHEGDPKFPSQVSGDLGGPNDPTVDMFKYFPKLADFVGKRNLVGYEESSSEDVLWVGKVISKTLNVRNKPTTKGTEILRTLNEGDYVKVYGRKGNDPFHWLRVGDNEYVSNARGEYVEEAEEPLFEAETSTRLNVRKDTNTNKDPIRTLDEGTPLNIYAVLDGEKPHKWAYIGNGEFVAESFLDSKLHDEIIEGDRVRVEEGTRTSDGGRFIKEVFERDHKVQTIKDNRALITFTGIPIDWVDLGNLKKV